METKNEQNYTGLHGINPMGCFVIDYLYCLVNEIITDYIFIIGNLSLSNIFIDSQFRK